MPNSGTNVFLLTVDALRADHLSYRGYGRPTSPRLDRIAENHTQFTNAFSASSHTREAIPALLTGRYPSESTDDGFILAADTLATQLRDTDYSTGAFHSNPYVSRAYGFDRDFDGFDDDLYLGNNKFIALVQRAFDRLRHRHYARAETINERALDWIDSQDGPVLLWNHYMDAHGPYDPPEDYRKRFYDGPTSRHDPQELYKRAAVTDPDGITNEERREMIDHYDGEISYVDACINDLLISLEDRGLVRDSLIIVTADHGDAFGDHGYYGHPRYLHDELVHVPMIASGPGMLDVSVETPVSTLDVVPTILDFVGVGYDSLAGRSLFDLTENLGRSGERRVFSSARGEDEDAHLRRFSVRTADDQCFLERDIQAGKVCSMSPKDRDPALETALREYSKDRLTPTQPSMQTRNTEPTGHVERRLEALGYKGDE